MAEFQGIGHWAQLPRIGNTAGLNRHPLAHLHAGKAGSLLYGMATGLAGHLHKLTEDLSQGQAADHSLLVKRHTHIRTTPDERACQVKRRPR